MYLGYVAYAGGGVGKATGTGQVVGCPAPLWDFVRSFDRKKTLPGIRNILSNTEKAAYAF